jgi:hypothetical protein
MTNFLDYSKKDFFGLTPQLQYFRKIVRKLKTVSSVLCQTRRKLKTVSVCTTTETENRFRRSLPTSQETENRFRLYNDGN